MQPTISPLIGVNEHGVHHGAHRGNYKAVQSGVHHFKQGRMRHSRHLGGRPGTMPVGRSLPAYEALQAEDLRPDRLYNSVVSSSLMDSTSPKLTVQDNHKPVFTNCSRYAPVVLEEQPVGTEVMKVHAIDTDPFESGGNITYSFVSAIGERLKFSINPRDGLITTKHIFDRDEPSREKVVYVTVRASDNGRPQLDDVCTIKVTIQDTNDNSPVFDKVNYLESVPQDLVPGREVMRISATDIDDGDNGVVVYGLEPKAFEDREYFKIDTNTGVIILNRTIDKEPSYKFRMRATATDKGEEPNEVSIDLEIIVVESHKKAPTFTAVPYGPIFLKENYSDFSIPIVTLDAESNIPEYPELIFELVTGRTEQTNKLNTFVLETEAQKAHIKLGRRLDYESINDYTLTIRVQNKYSLAAEEVIRIKVEDVNDNIPAFTEVISGSVFEHEPPGTPVMQVRAFDADGTSANNQVRYELGDHENLFEIDPITGNITTLVEFDREKTDFYNVKVIALDNSPTSLIANGKPNKGQQTFKIDIADKNDNPPRFTNKNYIAEAIPEDSNVNSVVTEVKANDNDTASAVMYSIIDGNTFDAFAIEKMTGKIRVNKPLDYENTTSYILTVRAFDGLFSDEAKVEIRIENVNDNRPVFLPYEKNVTIEEEKLVNGCIANLKAYDPDIQDRSAPQHIVYFVVKEDQQKLLTINNEGCLSLIKPLDRDPPGYPIWQVLISAKDEDGGPTSQGESTEVVITLIDINDNAPFLSMDMPVVWNENVEPGKITELIARDNDSEENGAPFTFSLDAANEDIRNKFSIIESANGSTSFSSRVSFDREETKYYLIPITIRDSGLPPMTGTSTLTLVIGDENDNAMQSGSSSVFVYNYKGEAPDTNVGRVYVEDPDDWDLPDKTFVWSGMGNHPNFNLDHNTGTITMLAGTPNGTYYLEFLVTERSSHFPTHSVNAYVNVTVKEIPEIAVDRSGSIRLSGITQEEFVAPINGVSKKDILQSKLATIFNVSRNNVDVFTVLHSLHHPLPPSHYFHSPSDPPVLLDVRFSAHGSPYYHAEKVNSMTSNHLPELEKALGVEIQMVNIDECIVEKASCEASCVNFLNKSSEPWAVYTNLTSFVGVNAVVDPLCTCLPSHPEVICLNGGTPVGHGCECPEGFEGPFCESLDVGFNGDGWALYPTLEACADSHLSLELSTLQESGLVFYVGPVSTTGAATSLGVKDFMALELFDGYPRVLMDYGSGTVKVEQRQIKLADGKPHRIDILWTNMSIELKVDSCQMSSCLSLTTPNGPNEFLNVNGPLQIGGVTFDIVTLGRTLGWNHIPGIAKRSYSGCVRNLTMNGRVYDLGFPSLSKNAIPGCSRGIAKAVSFGINSNFLVAILVCIAILLILVLAVVVNRKKRDDLLKDSDDIRETIINYEDEGGGEGDMTGYDLNVLRLPNQGMNGLMKGKRGPLGDDDEGYDEDDDDPRKETRPLGRAPDEVPDICGFLVDKKAAVDKDPETNPFDDVRHYAYEGDGNSTGSLSSLASGTDEGDLNFDYLSSFGPRFRKLADMYGEHSSDEEEDQYNQMGSESWC
ncbi:DE-cadherin isoform X3 [Ischnura elegans]|uniref:DE-cadherin isoform X3 n=1 Tax=Ischnura elegans TaxID=197161 RepID=UPI001ED8AF99|nr:DE-cadherin isoform X3 [Ischnura elegans]